VATSQPDDGIPILTDIVDGNSVPPARPLYTPRKPPETLPAIDAGSPSGFGSAGGTSSGFANASFPNTGFGAAARPTPAGPKAPPLSGPPSLSEFNTSAGTPRPAPASASPASITPAPMAPASISPASIAPGAPAPGTPAASALSADAVIQRVQAAVIERMINRIEPLVEARLQEAISRALDPVIAQLSMDLKDAATKLVREAAAQAVADEITVQRNRAAQAKPNP
jgi:hypothetical protein